MVPALHAPASSHFVDTRLFLPVRRNHPRYPVQKFVSYRYEGKSFLTHTLDPGLEGMKIKTPQYLPQDVNLNFKLILGKRLIWLKGRIVYSRFLFDKQGVSGIHFEELSAKDNTLLQDYLGTLDKWPKPGGMISTAEKKDAEPDSRGTEGQ